MNELGGTRPPDQPEQVRPAETQAPAEQREARQRAEPRSRAEVAAEARAITVRPDERPQPDGRGTVAQTPADRPSSQVRVVRADRTVGDTTPAGIGLKPDGTQLRDMEGDKLSRRARFRKELYREAEDIQDVTEKNITDIASLLGPHPPAGHAETLALPSIETSAPPPVDAGNLATAGLALGLVAERAISWASDHLRRPEG